MHPVINFRAEGVKFYFDVIHQFTKINDNSGVGKTFLCKSIVTSINTSKDTGVYPVKNLETGESINTLVIDGLEPCTEATLNKIKQPNSLILIDEADNFLLNNKKVIRNILENKSSYFIFMLRAIIENLEFDYSEYAKLEITKKEINIRYFS